MITSGFHVLWKWPQLRKQFAVNALLSQREKVRPGAQVMRSDKNDLASQVTKLKMLWQGAQGQQIWESLGYTGLKAVDM